MLHAVFICDKEWNIQSFMSCSPELPLQEGACLADLVEESEELRKDAGARRALLLTFPQLEKTMPAKIRIFPEGILVALCKCTDELEFVEAADLYERGVEWAKDHFRDIFHDEYYMIQQLNNQLIDSKRSLARMNQRLQHTLLEVEQTNEELNKAKQMTEQAMDLAQKASQSKSVFLANMSHDIRTPMNAIVGLSYLMKNEITNTEKLEAYIDKLQTTSQHLLGMLNDILDISKIESGAFTLRKESMNLSEQIKQIVTVVRPQTQEKNQKLEITASEWKHENFLGDASRVRQVLLNVLSNAVKYTPEGGNIWFEIEELAAQKETQALYRFTIRDNGIGMKQEYLQHIFEPYSRSEESQRSGISGTGLGMVIVRNFVDLMGGTIQVDSTFGEGSTFVITLPFEIDKSQSDSRHPQAALDVETAGETVTEEMESVLRGKRILCAEDNELNAEILQAMLEMAGASCTICENGEKLVQAFTQSAAGEYDFILTDVQMPVMDGYTAVTKLRASSHPEAKTIPIIAMTANVFAEDIQKCLDCGMNAHVGKPIDLGVLEKTIKKL